MPLNRTAIHLRSMQIATMSALLSKVYFLGWLFDHIVDLVFQSIVLIDHPFIYDRVAIYIC